MLFCAARPTVIDPMRAHVTVDELARADLRIRLDDVGVDAAGDRLIPERGAPHVRFPRCVFLWRQVEAVHVQSSMPQYFGSNRSFWLDR